MTEDPTPSSAGPNSKRTRSLGSSPYIGSPSEKWREVTKTLVAKHPVLGSPTLLPAILRAWQAVWSTTVGAGELAIPFRELNPRSQIIGDFFEAVLALPFAMSGPWRRGSTKEKDVVHTGGKRDLDFEIKTSGQAGGKIFGNRSYAQPGKDGTIDSASRKARSGYYLCVNFWQDRLVAVRVGWIDAADWEPQKSPTGQMAGLKPHVYDYKLLPITGSYYCDAPLVALRGLGQTTLDALAALSITTVGGLISPMTSSLSANLERVPTVDELVDLLIPVGIGRSLARRIARAIADSQYFRTACGYAVRAQPKS